MGVVCFSGRMLGGLCFCGESLAGKLRVFVHCAKLRTMPTTCKQHSTENSTEHTLHRSFHDEIRVATGKWQLILDADAAALLSLNATAVPPSTRPLSTLPLPSRPSARGQQWKQDQHRLLVGKIVLFGHKLVFFSRLSTSDDAS